MAWRGPDADPAPPEPWPSRHEAFLAACAIHAGERERDLLDIVTGFSEAMAKSKQNAR